MQPHQLSFFDDPTFVSPGPVRAAGSLVPLPRLARTSPLPVLLLAYHQALLGQGRARATIRDALREIERLATAAAPRAVTQLTTADLHTYLGTRDRGAGQRYRPKTVEKQIGTLKSFYGYLAECGVIARDPARAIAYPKVTRAAPEVLPGPAAEARFLAAIGDPCWRALALVFLDAGLKRDEALRLTPADVILDDPRPRLIVRRPPEAVQGENRILLLTPRLAAALGAALQAPRSPTLLFPLHVRSVAWQFRHFGQVAGLPGPVSAQVLRNTYAVRWMAARQSDWIGHPEAKPRDWTTLLRLLGLTPHPSNDGLFQRYEQQVPHWLQGG